MLKNLDEEPKAHLGDLGPDKPGLDHIDEELLHLILLQLQ